ncbi:phosphoprotein phosphatase [Nitzschia inconspicua]|uniref:Phosphoprotein phosphatase n=1 Tax=Nitzschia inconspicua TaxID=303405 RepID=A0A9K3LD75_9STRA|nr:phosphoprotein phosphatase [Nitzschia inconspicua]
MFIKKDLRKIPKILEDAVDCRTNDGDDDADDIMMANDENGANNKHNNSEAPDAKRTKVLEPLKELRLSRRFQEFQGTVQILCQPEFAPKLTQLKSLNLYDCQISNLEGLGDMFGTASPNLETLNLGRNPLSTIPDDFAKMKSLKNIWMDDCQLNGPLPKALMKLPQLESLRLPHNNITEIVLLEDTVDTFDSEVSSQPNLKLLCLDRNSITDLPTKMKDWVPNLEELLVRHNRLERLGTNVLPSTLRILHISSNQLTSLDDILHWKHPESNDAPLSHCPRLTHIYANSNQLTHIPEGFVTCHSQLQRLVLSHNPPLRQLPQEIWDVLEQNDEGASTACEIL